MRIRGPVAGRTTIGVFRVYSSATSMATTLVIISRADRAAWLGAVSSAMILFHVSTAVRTGTEARGVR